MSDLDEEFDSEYNGQYGLEEESDLPPEPVEELDELSKEFVRALVDKIMQFMEMLVGHELHNYQKPLARRVIESIIINDGYYYPVITSEPIIVNVLQNNYT